MISSASGVAITSEFLGNLPDNIYAALYLIGRRIERNEELVEEPRQTLYFKVRTGYFCLFLFIARLLLWLVLCFCRIKTSTSFEAECFGTGRSSATFFLASQVRLMPHFLGVTTTSTCSEVLDPCALQYFSTTHSTVCLNKYRYPVLGASFRWLLSSGRLSQTAFSVRLHLQKYPVHVARWRHHARVPVQG